jgi:hypothetical protein
METLKNTHRKTTVTLTTPSKKFCKGTTPSKKFCIPSARTHTHTQKVLIRNVWRHVIKYYSSRETVPFNKARAVPAHRQRRLFDETREAEKVVQFLAGLSPGDMAQLLLPTLLQAAHARCACAALPPS